MIWTLFMFMVGVSMTFSLAKRKRMHESHGTLYAHAVKRAVLLFILGMIAQGNLLQFNLSTFHPFYSVLHGIAAGYLIATIVTLNFKVKGQAITTAIFLVSYWILLLTIPVPGVGQRGIDSTWKCGDLYRSSGVWQVFLCAPGTREHLDPELPGICIISVAGCDCW